MLALGMMSGTSLDGVDAAMIDTDGEAIAGFGRSGFRAYGREERAGLRGALGAWPEALGPEVEPLVRKAHAELAADFPEAEVVGFHGQTLAHDPAGRGTHQAGRGDLLAHDTAIARDECPVAVLDLVGACPRLNLTRRVADMGHAPGDPGLTEGQLSAMRIAGELATEAEVMVAHKGHALSAAAKSRVLQGGDDRDGVAVVD